MPKDHPRKWDPHTKPPSLLCPRDYCFFWAQTEDPHGRCNYPGRWVQAPGTDRKPIICGRLDAAHGTGDYYEPNESRLEKAGLPWFYFFPNADTLIDELKDGYLRGAEELWGQSSEEDAF